MRLHAYVLAGDPAWVAQSIGSYYHLVDRIVVSYDAGHKSWSGAPLSVEESLRRLAAADPDEKAVLLPGRHAEPDRLALTLETEQRQVALDAASEGADWVIQLDTDEIVPDPGMFASFIRTAADHAAEALAYPARMMRSRTPTGAFLEHCGRFWTTQAGYPGPVAVRAGTSLTHARQAADAPHFRVDVAPWNTDPAHPSTTPVHAVVARDKAIVHMTWVRTEAQMAEKRVVSGHAPSRDWDAELARWLRGMRHPYLTAAAAPFARNPFERFRVTRLPEFADIDF